MKKVISFVLAFLMLASAFTIIPPLEVDAADGTIPGAVSMSPIDGYSTTEVTLRGKITANGGSEIKRYGFHYGVAGSSKNETKEWYGHLRTGEVIEFELTGLQPNTTIWYCFYAVNSTGTAKDASDRDEVVNGTQYASTLPEIELEIPDIISPDSYEVIVAGEDVEFEWDEIDNAKKYEWELYEADKTDGRYLTSGTTINEYVILDGDWFEGNNVYSFYVRAVSGDVSSDWGKCIYLICQVPDSISVEENDFQIGSEGGTGYIRLTSTVAWEAIVSNTWIAINKTSGTGDAEIRVQVEPNSGDSRTGSVIIHNELGSIYVTIHQHSGTTPYLAVSTNRIELSSENDSYSFYISSNVNWEIFCDSDWVRNISKEDGYGDESIQVLVNKNTSTRSRTAIITIEGDGITKTVTITQEGRPAVVGDINNDGEITNKDRFLLNRYLAKMSGYTDIDKTLADINGDKIINQADAEYLSRHLASWAGYEKLPEINAETSVCAHTQYTDTYLNTEYVSSTIKTNTTHTYYHVYNRKCNCGVDVGKVQGELITEAHSYVNNLCACGAYNDASYKKWTGVNVSGAQVNVYSTPSATVRYGYINKNEVVTVIGESGDKYLIEYTLDGDNGVKQGYINNEALLVQIANQYETNHIDYAHKHKICTYRTDGVLLSVLAVEEHIFNKTEITYRYVDNGNSSHSVYADQYDICECGFSKLVATEIYKTTAPHSASNNDKYVCRLCAGNIHYLSNPTPNTSYAINYQGTEYPISFPDYDYVSNSNYDITFGGWSTVYEKVYNDRKWDIANFVGNLELDDESYLLAGIALTEQLLTNLVHTDFIKVVLQKNETTGKNRALILIGDNSSINRGEVGSNKCLYIQCTNNMAFTGNNVPPYVNYNDGKEIADWLVRSSGISLPSEGWSIDDKLLYNVDIVYSNNWNTFDNYYKYLSFNEKGEAVTIERIMSGDRYQLTAYEDDTLLQIVLNDLPIINSLVRPYLTENIKNYFVQPIQADSGEFIAKFSEEFNIVKITK